MNNREYRDFLDRMYDLENSVRKELLFRYADKYEDTLTPDAMLQILRDVCAEVAEKNSTSFSEAYVIQNYLVGELSVQCMKMFLAI